METTTGRDQNLDAFIDALRDVRSLISQARAQAEHAHRLAAKVAKHAGNRTLCVEIDELLLAAKSKTHAWRL